MNLTRGALKSTRAVRKLLLTERQLSRCQRELQAAERRLAEQSLLMAMVGHDLRSPLQTLSIALALIEGDVTPAMAKPLHHSKASLSRARALVLDLLEFTRAQQGQGIALHPQPTRLFALLAGAMEEAELRFPKRSLSLTTGDTEGLVCVDPQRINQVLDNLISNALIHSPRSSEVRLALETDRDHLVLTVCNQGRIPDAVRARLFAPLNRGPDAGCAGGLGLGLYIAKQLVEAHGGEIDGRSEGAETTFRVRLRRLID